jgi:hypothetical protein
MKNIIIILLLCFSLTANAQERKTKCIVTKIEYIEDYKVKVTTINKCTKVVVVRSYLRKEWEEMKKKRKNKKRTYKKRKN